MRMVNNGTIFHEPDRSAFVDVYPLSSYYFNSKSPIPINSESPEDRLQRIELNFNTRGLRTCVVGVMLVELFKHPHLLLLQARNSVFKLPCGRLRQGESDVDGMMRKLSKLLSSSQDQTNWQVTDDHFIRPRGNEDTDSKVEECIGVWWRTDFETPLVTTPPNGITPKECVKVFLVKLPEGLEFTVPRNLKFLAVPIGQLEGNSKTYGNVIAGVPAMLSKFSFHIR